MADGAPIKQHLIDPEICIRCYTCENTCPIGAIEHDDENVVVDPAICNHCMACIPVCPTGSIDEWRVVETPYSLEEQYGWEELPEQEEIAMEGAPGEGEAVDDAVAALLAEAHSGAGGASKPPVTAGKPQVGLYAIGKPATGKVIGNYRLTDDEGYDVRHVILDFGAQPMPVLEGQSLGVIPPGTDGAGKPHLPRLYSVSSPRDGERPNYNFVSLTVKRDEGGVASNHLCDAGLGDEIAVTGPFGATFLMPDDAEAPLLMICTGTGSAPMRAFTMRRQRTLRGGGGGRMTLFFGARSPGSLPYFGPLGKVPEALLEQHLVYSRTEGQEYVQDRMVAESERVAALLAHPKLHVYVCGLRGMEEGVEKALTDIAESIGQPWRALRDVMRGEGRYHVETY